MKKIFLAMFVLLSSGSSFYGAAGLPEWLASQIVTVKNKRDQMLSRFEQGSSWMDIPVSQSEIDAASSEEEREALHTKSNITTMYQEVQLFLSKKEEDAGGFLFVCQSMLNQSLSNPEKIESKISEWTKPFRLALEYRSNDGYGVQTQESVLNQLKKLRSFLQSYNNLKKEVEINLNKKFPTSVSPEAKTKAATLQKMADEFIAALQIFKFTDLSDDDKRAIKDIEKDGVPSEIAVRDWFYDFDINESAKPVEIKKSYARTSLFIHPDKIQGKKVLSKKQIEKLQHLYLPAIGAPLEDLIEKAFTIVNEESKALTDENIRKTYVRVFSQVKDSVWKYYIKQIFDQTKNDWADASLGKALLQDLSDGKICFDSWSSFEKKEIVVNLSSKVEIATDVSVQAYLKSSPTDGIEDMIKVYTSLVPLMEFIEKELLRLGLLEKLKSAQTIASFLSKFQELLFDYEALFSKTSEPSDKKKPAKKGVENKLDSMLAVATSVQQKSDVSSSLQSVNAILERLKVSKADQLLITKYSQLLKQLMKIKDLDKTVFKPMLDWSYEETKAKKESKQLQLYRVCTQTLSDFFQAPSLLQKSFFVLLSEFNEEVLKKGNAVEILFSKTVQPGTTEAEERARTQEMIDAARPDINKIIAWLQHELHPYLTGCATLTQPVEQYSHGAVRDSMPMEKTTSEAVFIQVNNQIASSWFLYSIAARMQEKSSQLSGFCNTYIFTPKWINTFLNDIAVGTMSIGRLERIQKALGNNSTVITGELKQDGNFMAIFKKEFDDLAGLYKSMPVAVQPSSRAPQAVSQELMRLQDTLMVLAG